MGIRFGLTSPGIRICTKLTFKKTKGNVKIKVAKNGKATLAKGLKRATYKVRVRQPKMRGAGARNVEKGLTLFHISGTCNN